MSVLSAIIAAIRAVPALISLVEMFYEKWIDAQIKEATDANEIEKKKILYVKRQIRQAKTDEERIAFSIVLRDYRSGKMQ